MTIANSNATHTCDAAVRSSVTVWLSRQPQWVLTLYAMAAAFAAYASMYAFRKPFTAAGYKEVSDIMLFGTAFGYKSILVIAQIFGYMLSKFMGIKFASEASFSRRVPMVMGLILSAELALLLFAVVPAPWNIACIFANGLPLGMIWSLIFGVLEGRRITEFLALGLSVSVIFASGWVKSVGTFMMQTVHVPEFWMPVASGAAFIPLMLLSLYMLAQVPKPDAKDIANRTEREPMDRSARRAFIRRFVLGLLPLILGYMAIMTFRDLRDSFMLEFLKEQHHHINESTFATIETAVGIIIMVMMLGTFPFIRRHRAAVWASMSMMAGGAVLIGMALLAFQAGWIGPILLLIALGVGIYMGFVPIAILFDRLLASLHTVATASFLMVVADAYSYLSTVGLYVTKDIVQKVSHVSISWSQYIIWGGYLTAVVVPVCLMISAVYFHPRMRD